jgi:hypothetical protein
MTEIHGRYALVYGLVLNFFRHVKTFELNIDQGDDTREETTTVV